MSEITDLTLLAVFIKEHEDVDESGTVHDPVPVASKTVGKGDGSRRPARPHSSAAPRRVTREGEAGDEVFERHLWQSLSGIW